MGWTNESTALSVSPTQTVAEPVTFLSTVTFDGAVTFANDVSSFATGGSGTVADPWTGWEMALNALPTSSYIHFPAGSYTQTAMITVKDRWKIIGDGRGATVITSTFAGTAFRINSVTSPALGYISIRDLRLVNTNASNTGSGILVVGAFFSDVSDVVIDGFRYGVTEINAEVFSCNRVTLDAQLRACVWIVNNGDYNLTYADLNYSSYAGGGTNRVSFYDCQFNGSTANTPVLVIDDGGGNHDWINCNFNAGGSAFHMAGVSCATCYSGEFEGQTADLVVTSLYSYNSTSGVGPNYELAFQSNTMVPDPTKACFDATSIESLLLIGNRFSTPIAAVKNSSGCNLFNIRSVMNNGPLYSGTPASYFDLGSTATPALTTSLAISTDGNISATTAGSGLRVKTGSNARLGSSTLVGGTVTVSNTSVTANTKVFLTRSTTGGTTGQLSYTKSAGVSFTITSSSGTDTSTIEWMLVEAL